MRVAAYITGVLNALIWTFGVIAGYQLALVVLGLRSGACCVVYRSPEYVTAGFGLGFPIAVLATTIWVLLSGRVGRRPNVATVAFGVSMAVGVIFYLFLESFVINGPL